MRIVIVIAMFCAFVLNLNAQDELSPEMMFALTNGMPPHVKFKGYCTAEMHANEYGQEVMKFANFPDGDDNLICTNWVCPTSIVVNAKSYELSTNVWDNGVIDITLMCSNSMVATGFTVKVQKNEKDARRWAFAEIGATPMFLGRFIRCVLALPLNASTNSLYLAFNNGGNVDRRNFLVHKNIIFRYFRSKINEPELMPVAIMTAILNAGLPENERIDLSKVDQEKLQKCME